VGNLSLALKHATVRPKPTIITIRKDDKENEKPKNEKITTKKTTKIKPNRTLKVLFCKKSKEEKGSVILPKNEANFTKPNPIRYKIIIVEIEKRTDSVKLI
jgi:hypothetical protein